MAYDVPCSEPTLLRAGDSWRWDRTFADYPVSEGWVLSYAFLSLSDATAAGKLTWDANWVTDDGITFSVAIPATATATLSAGAWRWAAFVTLDDDRFTAAEGTVQVESNLATAAAGAEVTWASEMLAVVRAEIQARINGTGSAHEGYTIGDRALNKMSMAELNKMEASLSARVNGQSPDAGFGRKIVGVMRRPGPASSVCGC